MVMDLDAVFAADLSDECAYELINFLENLILVLESQYYGQIKRYIRAMDSAVE